MIDHITQLLTINNNNHITQLLTIISFSSNKADYQATLERLAKDAARHREETVQKEEGWRKELQAERHARTQVRLGG